LSGYFIKKHWPVIVCAFLLTVTGECVPLKVYILAGQSNMQGHARISTLDYMKDDADTAAIYRKMVDGEGNPVVYERTWITYTPNYSFGAGPIVPPSINVGFTKDFFKSFLPWAVFAAQRSTWRMIFWGSQTKCATDGLHQDMA
jgi:hypothetical protein